MKHGGARSGAGKPGPYGEKTKPIRLPLSLIPAVQKFISHKGYKLPLYDSKVPAGFPSPADDHVAESLDLNEYLIKHPAATFFVRVSGTSMINAGISENDILIVDRSLTPAHGKIVIVAIDGQLTVKRLHKKASGQFILMPDNPDYEPMEIPEDSSTYIWGVVTSVIHAV
ncbi:MAG: translesion error-prone DNA polymerase V autoproteolytic subunit [Gammaproteobacteria bacterium]|nr:translesion error-prone DNA polymerase V autoproteolytic subunit [Gammaproteobacteria bacterium]